MDGFRTDARQAAMYQEIICSEIVFAFLKQTGIWFNSMWLEQEAAQPFSYPTR